VRALNTLVLRAFPPGYRGGVEKAIGEPVKQLVANSNMRAEIRSVDLSSDKSCVCNDILLKASQTNRSKCYASLGMLIDINKNLKKRSSCQYRSNYFILFLQYENDRGYRFSNNRNPC
jgi:hypothetical protein